MATLSSYDVNMDTGTVVLRFNSIINVLDPTQLTAVSNSAGNANPVALGGTVTNQDTNTLTLALSQPVLNKIKTSGVLWNVSNANTYLNATSTATSPGITTVTGLQATTYTVDSTAPTLSSWSYQGGNTAPWNLSLTFSEPIYANTFTSTAITLQETGSGGNNYTLTGGTVIPATGLVTTALLKLSQTDITGIAGQTGLLANANTSYISLSASVANDRAGTAVTNILSTSAQKTANYTANGVVVGYSIASTADLRIAGGDANQFISTDGKANLSWSDGGGTLAANTVNAATYTVLNSDQVLYVSYNDVVTITMPAATNSTIGKSVIIKDILGPNRANTNPIRPIIITANGAQTIDGQANVQITGPYNSLTIIGVTSNTWGII